MTHAPPLPLRSPPDRLAPCGGLTRLHQPCRIVLWPTKLDAALWRALISEMWVGVKCATSNTTRGSKWVWSPLCPSLIAPGIYLWWVVLFYPGPRKTVVGIWHEQGRHFPYYNLLRSGGYLLPTINLTRPDWYTSSVCLSMRQHSLTSEAWSLVRYTWVWVPAPPF